MGSRATRRRCRSAMTRCASWVRSSSATRSRSPTPSPRSIRSSGARAVRSRSSTRTATWWAWPSTSWRGSRIGSDALPRSARGARLDGGDLVDGPVAVVGGPFADLYAVVEGAGPELAAVLAKPLPIADHLTIQRLASGPDGTVLVIGDVL